MSLIENVFEGFSMIGSWWPEPDSLDSEGWTSWRRISDFEGSGSASSFFIGSKSDFFFSKVSWISPFSLHNLISASSICNLWFLLPLYARSQLFPISSARNRKSTGQLPVCWTYRFLTEGVASRRRIVDSSLLTRRSRRWLLSPEIKLCPSKPFSRTSLKVSNTVETSPAIAASMHLK